MTIPTQAQAQLKSFQESGDAANYYKTIAQHGHDYGNLAYEAATDSGFWGRYANNHLENKAAEYGIAIDRNKIMQELMAADYQLRKDNNWAPIPANEIRKYHEQVFDKNKLPPEAWTGTFFDNRLGPASWCIGCNNVERQDQTPQDALNQLWDNLSNDWNGTFDEAFDFFQDALGDGTFSETMADLNLDATDSIELSGLVKALFQVLAMSAQGWMNIASWLQGLLESASEYPSPIVLDLDGDGVETSSVGSGAYFDHAADGFAELTGWAASDDGLLVRDLDGNGSINSGRELFGSETLLPNGTKAANGFEALKALDANADGVINAQDAAFAELRVWKDANANGRTDAGELLTLAEAGVGSINVSYTNSSYIDIEGNAHRQVGNYTATSGETRAATDIWVQTNTTQSLPTDWINVSADIAALPDAQGYGLVRDLHQATARKDACEFLTIQTTLGIVYSFTYSKHMQGSLYLEQMEFTTKQIGIQALSLRIERSTRQWH